MHTISTILFDLGGVLLELDGPPIKRHWISETLTHEQNWLTWMSSPTVKAFETGMIDGDEFVARVVPELGLAIDTDTFRQAFIEWPKALFPGVPTLLTALKARYRLAFYSNTNALHLPRLLHELALASYFHHTYASYQIGYFKPDVAGFDFVAKDMAVAAAEILFLDDNQINVDGARRAGLHAQKTVGLEQVKAVLRDYAIAFE